MERRLGRGLSSLLSPTPEPERGAIRELRLASIHPNPYQPRKTFEDEPLEELRESIRVHGVLQPIVVRTKGESFEIIAGERRWRASRLAGRETIPAVIRDGVTDDEMLELALVENVQRADLGPIEKAQGFLAMKERLDLTEEEVAQRVGLQRTTVANQIRLLELPEEVQQAVQRGLVSMGHARALLGLVDEKAQLQLLERIAREELSVRATERLVREARGASSKARDAEPARAPLQPPWVQEIQRRLQDSLGTRVRLTSDPSCKGQLVIDFARREELERLLERLAPAAPLL